MAASTPRALLRKKETQLSAQNQEPVSSRLRPRFKPERVGRIDVTNQTDKPSQVSKNLKIQSSSIVAKKVEVPTIGQASKVKSTKKSTDSKPKSIEVHAASCSRAGLSLKDQGAETKGKQELKNQHAKREASQTPQCGNKTSSSSRKRQNEEPIASLLRSPFKTGCIGRIDVNNQTDKPRLVLKHLKSQSSRIVAKKSEVPTIAQPSKDKSTKKINDSKPQSTEVHAASSSRASLCSKDQSAETKGKQDLKNQHAKRVASQPPQWGTNVSSISRKKHDLKITKNLSIVTNKSKAYGPSSSNMSKGKEKIIPSPEKAQKPMYEHPIYYIKCTVSEEIHAFSNCALCEGTLEYPSYDEEDELLDSLYLDEIEELGPAIPEAAVLPCGHVFHSTCLTLAMTELIDPPCPLCLSMME